jgi:pSer/pThr/pTyr-binding forkhead associated (FHA) protein
MEGENTIGRDPRSLVWIDASGVSRRHALIRVGDGGITIEDLGSSNGTFVGGREIHGPHELTDGDTIELGTAAIAFRAWPGGGPPETERIRRRVTRRG